MFNQELEYYLSRHTLYLNQSKNNYCYLHIVYYYSMKCDWHIAKGVTS